MAKTWKTELVCLVAFFYRNRFPFLGNLLLTFRPLLFKKRAADSGGLAFFLIGREIRRMSAGWPPSIRSPILGTGFEVSSCRSRVSVWFL
jgi:hypothetical protein